MLLGAIVGKKKTVISGKKSTILLITCVITYFAIVILSQRNVLVNKLQLISLLPLLGITLFTYTIFNSNKIAEFFKNRYVNKSIMFVGGLCLEIYLIQIPLLKIDLGLPFPINYIAMFALIILSAYILRCFARIFSQTFNKQDYNWKEVFKPF